MAMMKISKLVGIHYREDVELAENVGMKQDEFHFGAAPLNSSI